MISSWLSDGSVSGVNINLLVVADPGVFLSCILGTTACHFCAFVFVYFHTFGNTSAAGVFLICDLV